MYKLPAFVISILLFTLLFHYQLPGINFLLFELLIIAYLLVSKQFVLKSFITYFSLFGTILTSIAVATVNSKLSVAVNILFLILFTGISVYPQARSILNGIQLGVYNIPNSIPISTKLILGRKGKFVTTLFRYKIFIIPILIIVTFLIIYASANSIFSEGLFKLMDNLFEPILRFLGHCNLSMILTMAFGFIVSSFLLFQNRNEFICDKDKNAKEEIERKNRIEKRGRRKSFVLNALKNEFRSAVFLLIILNLLIAVLNTIDITHLWFGFHWTGEDFAVMLHEGTGLLIFSVLISMAVVLYYLRGNLNFYYKHKILRLLAFAWIAQNGIMVISVMIRNYYYISYFSLAYKRIGVFIFLIMVLIGLITILIKIREKKTSFYLFKANSLSVMAVLMISSLMNWDVIIAKYNFSKIGESFIYLDYLSTLSDKALPYIDKSPEELENLLQKQDDTFSFRERYMSKDQYHEIITMRKTEFINRWEKQDIWSWNWAEYSAYRKLTGQE